MDDSRGRRPPRDRQDARGPGREYGRPSEGRGSSAGFERQPPAPSNAGFPQQPAAPSFESTARAAPSNAGEAFFDDEAPAAPRREREPRREAEVGMETFRIEVGHVHGVKPGNIVGAIANEAELESRFIGRIDIRDAYSLIDLPEGMPREVMDHLKRVRVAGQQLKISRDEGGPRGGGQRPHGGRDRDDARPPRGPRPPGGGRPPGGPRKSFGSRGPR